MSTDHTLPFSDDQRGLNMTARSDFQRIIFYDYNEKTGEAGPSYLSFKLLNMKGPRWP
jgi:hypothetical protein